MVRKRSKHSLARLLVSSPLPAVVIEVPLRPSSSPASPSTTAAWRSWWTAHQGKPLAGSRSSKAWSARLARAARFWSVCT